MSEMQQRIVELINEGRRNQTVAETVGCSKAYVSFVRRGKRGAYLTCAMRQLVCDLWLHQDLSADVIAISTGLALDKVIACILELEQKEAPRCRA